MRPLDLIRNAVQGRRELAELRDLYGRLQQHAGDAEERRDDLCSQIVAGALDLAPDDPVPPVAEAAWQLCHALLAYEGHLNVPDLDLNRPLGTAEMWEIKAAVSRALAVFEQSGPAELIANLLTHALHRLADGVPAADEADGG